ncbi:MAG: CBS domain-containing protein [Pseudomonadota bacterium]
MNVNDVLSQKPIDGVESIGAQETVSTLVSKLREKKIGAMMVTDRDGRLVGVISERDVIRALAEDNAECLQNPVSRYMTSDVVATTPKENIFVVLDKMTQGRFRHMPVLESGALSGVISIGDVVKARIEALQKENEALETFIRS